MLRAITTEDSVLEGTPNSQILREAVRRLLETPTFRRAQRLSELLDYLARQTLAGDTESMKEGSIGQAVFGRPAKYNAAEDNIVRANVRQLRLRLEEYYSADGAHEDWRIVIPKGSYGIVIQRLESFKLDYSRQAKDPPVRPGKLSVFLWVILLAGVCVAAGALVGFWAARPGVPPAPRPEKNLLSLLAPDSGQRLLVVVPDANVQLFQRLTGKTVTLNDYTARTFEQPESLRSTSPVLAESTHALFASSTTQSFVLGLIPKLISAATPSKLSVRHPSILTAADFEKDNAVLISGPFGDPWVQLFDRDLNFQIESSPDNSSAHITNKQPRGSERARYANFVDPSNTVVCYSRVAYLPGRTTASRIILVGGPHVVSTEAASVFVTRSDSLEEVCRLFHVNNARRLPWFELVIEAHALGGTAWHTSIVAHRAVSGILLEH
jgi:hypothetical protein